MKTLVSGERSNRVKPRMAAAVAAVILGGRVLCGLPLPAAGADPASRFAVVGKWMRDRAQTFGSDVEIVDGLTYASMGAGLVVMERRPDSYPRLVTVQPFQSLNGRSDFDSDRRLLYTWAGNVLDVIDVSDARHPRHRVAFWDWPVDREVLYLIADVGHHGNYLYVWPASSNSPFVVLDTSNPDQPVVAGVEDVDNYQSYYYTLSVSYPYVYHGGRGQVVNVSDPANPTSLPDPPEGREVLGLDVDGTIAYTTDYFELKVTDYSTPTSPVLLSTLPLDGSDWWRLRYHDGKVYLASMGESSPGFRIVDVSDPRHPVPMGFIPGIRNGGLDFTVENDEVHLLTGSLYHGPYRSDGCFYTVIDVSDPWNPYVKEKHLMPTWAGESTFLVHDGALFIGGKSLFAYETDDFTIPQPIGGVSLNWNDERVQQITGMVHRDGYLLAAVYTWLRTSPDEYAYGLDVIDVRDPAHPTPALDIPLTSGPRKQLAGQDHSIVDSGSRLYLSFGGSEIHVMDCPSPTSPTLAAILKTAAPVRRLALEGDTLFSAEGAAGLRLYGIDGPATPTFTRSIPFADEVDDLLVSGTLVFVATVPPGEGLGSCSFRVVDFANPDAPVVRDALVTPSTTEEKPAVYSMALSPPVLYALTSEVLLAIDISDPDHLRVLASEGRLGSYSGAGSTVSPLDRLGVLGPYLFDGSSNSIRRLEDPLVSKPSFWLAH